MAYMIRLLRFPNDILKQIQLVLVVHRFESWGIFMLLEKIGLLSRIFLRLTHLGDHKVDI